MAFEFTRKASVAKNLRRLGGERIESAQASLSQWQEPEAIHAVRKEIKKLRALLRLFRAQMSAAAYDRMTKTLRQAAMHLATMRDAEVKVRAMEDLMSHVDRQLEAPTYSDILESLREERERTGRQFERRASPRALAHSLRQLSRASEKIRIRTRGWRAVRPGVQRTYREGQRGLKRVLREPTSENFHRWRQRVKELWHQMQLLRPSCPKPMGAAARQLEILGERLGEDHDLALLSASLGGKRRRRESPEPMEALRGVIDARQQELRRRAVALGRRVYGEKPVRFSRRLGRYWKAWRHYRKASPVRPR